MNAEEQKQAKALALYEYTEAKERYTLLKAEAERVALTHESIAKLFRERPETITMDLSENSALMQDLRKQVKLVEDLKATRSEVSRLESTVRQLGLSNMIQPPRP